MVGEEEEFLSPSETGDLEPGVRYELSPDGVVRVVYVIEERRHGETWEHTSVELAHRGRHLFSLPYFFEADVRWTGPHSFVMFAGEAYKGGSVRVDVDVDADGGKGRCVIAETGQSVRFRDAERLIERAYERHATYPEPSPDQSPPAVVREPSIDRADSRPTTTLKDWVLGLLLTAAFVAAVAYAIHGWHAQNPPEPLFPPPPKMKTVEPPSPSAHRVAQGLSAAL